VKAQVTVVDGVKKLIKDGSVNKAALDLDLKAKDKKMAAAKKVVKDKLDPKIVELKKKVEHWKTMVGKAEVQVKRVREKKDPKQTTAAAEDLLRQQQKRRQDALDAVAKVELEKTRATTDIKLQQKAIDAVQKKSADAAKAILSLKTEKAKQSGKLATLKAAAATARKKQEAAIKAKADKIKAMNAATKAVQKAKITLKFVKDGQAESKAALDRAKATKKAVKASHDLAKNDLKKAKANAVKATKTHKTTSDTLKKNKNILDTALKKTRRGQESLAEGVDKHIRMKPEVVAQHDLGL